MSVMRIAVALARDTQGRVLLVRKHCTAAFMQPGGKIEPGEKPAAALVRELAEELGLRISTADLAYLGQATAPAANEPGVMVEADIFGVTITASFTVQAELAEAVWVDPLHPGKLTLAPLTRDCVLPLAVPAS